MKNREILQVLKVKLPQGKYSVKKNFILKMRKSYSLMTLKYYRDSNLERGKIDRAAELQKQIDRVNEQ